MPKIGAVNRRHPRGKISVFRRIPSEISRVTGGRLFHVAGPFVGSTISVVRPGEWDGGGELTRRCEHREERDVGWQVARYAGTIPCKHLYA